MNPTTKVCLLLALTSTWAGAQIAAPLEVTASQPVRDQHLAVLAGANPAQAGAAQGCAVWILHAGTNGVPDAPGPDGGPSGDDTLLHVTCIGHGMLPHEPAPGRFDGSFLPAPAPGAPVFIRVFNAASPTGATHYGQTPVTRYEALKVLDATRLGLLRADLPLHPAGPDADGDGYSDLDEWLAGTHAEDAGDHPGAFTFKLDGGPTPLADGLAAALGQPVEVPAGAPRVSVDLTIRPGRRYRLERCTALAGATAGWGTVAEVADPEREQAWVLADDNPPAVGPLFYRLNIAVSAEAAP